MTNRDMYRVAVISQRVQNDFVTGLQVAKLNELKACMRREVVKFAYLKKSGEVRIAYGTMMPALVGDHINGRGVCGDEGACTLTAAKKTNNGKTVARLKHLCG